MEQLNSVSQVSGKFLKNLLFRRFLFVSNYQPNRRFIFWWVPRLAQPRVVVTAIFLSFVSAEGNRKLLIENLYSWIISLIVRTKAN